MRSAILSLSAVGLLAASLAARPAQAADANTVPVQPAVITQSVDNEGAVTATPVRYGRGYYYGGPRFYGQRFYGGPRYYGGRYGSDYRYDYRYRRPYRYYDSYPYYGGYGGYGGAYFRGPGFSFGFGY
jgi:hypothetical protein